jgi:hypothetical protein
MPAMHPVTVGAQGSTLPTNKRALFKSSHLLEGSPPLRFSSIGEGVEKRNDLMVGAGVSN